jgi:LPS sulfotransferase NodH
LADALSATGVGGRPEEYYWEEFRESYLDQWGRPPIDTYADFLSHSFHAGTTPNGVFGAKLHWTELDELLERLAELPESPPGESDDELLCRWFPEPRYVYLHRVDKVRQAISLFRASRTAEWYHVDGEASRQPRPLEPDWGQIHTLELMLRNHEQAWRDWFADQAIDPLEIVYEDLVSDYEQCVRATLEYLDLAADVPPPRLRRQRDDTTEAWVHEYLRVRRASWPPNDEAYGLGLINEWAPAS